MIYKLFLLLVIGSWSVSCDEEEDPLSEGVGYSFQYQVDDEVINLHYGHQEGRIGPETSGNYRWRKHCDVLYLIYIGSSCQMGEHRWWSTLSLTGTVGTWLQ